MEKNKRWIQIIILSATIVVGGFTIGSSLFSGSAIPQAGDKLPDFSLYGLDGQQHQASDYEGKVIMINFWGSFCPPCIDEMPAIQSQYEKWKNDDLVFLGVNLDEETITVKSFVKQNGLTFPILLDEKLQITKKFGVKQYPTTFFVNRKGRIEEIKVGAMTEQYIDQTLTALLSE